jgi:hypothetical protein
MQLSFVENLIPRTKENFYIYSKIPGFVKEFQ